MNETNCKTMWEVLKNELISLSTFVGDTVTTWFFKTTHC